MVFAPFCGEVSCEDWIKDKSGGVSSRGIPEQKEIKEKCVYCSKPAKYKVYFSKSYWYFTCFITSK